MNDFIKSIKDFFSPKKEEKPIALKTFREMTMDEIRDEYARAITNVQHISNEFDYADDMMLETIVHRYAAATEYAKVVRMAALMKERELKAVNMMA